VDPIRRRWSQAIGAWLVARPVAAASLTPAEQDVVRISLTAVILDDQVAFLHALREYLEPRIGRRVQFVQRGSYREISDLLRQNKVDFAWICGAPYVRMKADLRLVAVPLYQGRPLYQSYLIVPAADASTRSLLDLRGRNFCYSDPDSNSGFLYTQFALLQLAERPGAFFGRTFFTWAHRKVIEAVAAGLGQGGAVDGYVWETVARQHPELTRRTRVVERSPYFGFPPFVANARVPALQLRVFQQALLDMGTDAAGRRLLRRLNIDGFAVGEPALFDGIERMVDAVQKI
jgi:phosphonate transport system substrate-binding protein